MQNEILKVSGMDKSYGEELIFQNVNFKIREGEVVGFVGNNGTGKTTLMKIILGLTSYSAGKVEYLGDPHYLKKTALLNSIGYLMETPLYSYLDAHDTLKLMSYYSGENVDDTQINNLLDRVRLKAGGKKVKEYSFGMCQKLRLAIAFMYDRKLLILDEPTVGLDPQAVDEFIDIIKEMTAEKNVSVLLSSHQLEAIDPLCDRYLYISEHKIKEKSEITVKCMRVTLEKEIAEDGISFVKRTLPNIKIVKATIFDVTDNDELTMFLNYLKSHKYKIMAMEEKTVIDRNIYRREQQ